MQEVQIITRDDFDRSPGATTITFAYQGHEFEIDLSEEHRSELEAKLEPYMTRGRPAERKSKSARDRSGWTHMSHQETMERRAALRRIRAWAKEQGLDTAPRARIPADIHQAYNAAHPDDQVPLAAPGTVAK